jgi:hypothetical protein
VRTLLVVVVAFLAGACVVEPVDDGVEIVDDLEVAVESEVAELDEDWPDARRAMHCEDHYAACMQTKYGKIHDDPGHTRCQRCMERCLREDGCWPKKTYAGKDCDYKHPKFEGPPWREP